MKKISITLLFTSLIVSNMYSGNIREIENWTQFPLAPSITSKSRGGLLDDKTAATDGLGVILIHAINSPLNTTNSMPFNEVFYHNIERIDNDNQSIVDLIINDIITIPDNKLDIINNGNILVNGRHINGTPCDDLNPLTENSIWISDLCIGGTIPDGTLCNDNNTHTIHDMYKNSICQGTDVEGESCNDGNVGTINDMYIEGECKGTLKTGNCNDGNAMTVNDTYDSNGTCVGIDGLNQPCDDGKVDTINDKYYLYNGNLTCSGKYPIGSIDKNRPYLSSAISGCSSINAYGGCVVKTTCVNNKPSGAKSELWANTMDISGSWSNSSPRASMCGPANPVSSTSKTIYYWVIDTPKCKGYPEESNNNLTIGSESLLSFSRSSKTNSSGYTSTSTTAYGCAQCFVYRVTGQYSVYKKAQNACVFVN